MQQSIYKVRAVNTSANVGKSGGFRIIYLVTEDHFEIYLLDIYSKKDKENITNEQIKLILKNNQL